MRGLALGLTLAAALGGAALAHDGRAHDSVADARQHSAAMSDTISGPDTPFPLKLGGPFRLTDQAGHPRGAADPEGRLQLVFFGYANCQSICSVALPLMAEITDRLAAEGVPLAPVMITVDPARDTVETMAALLTLDHPDFIGLTGTEAELEPVYKLFSVEKSVVFDDPVHGPVYAHGSHIYLMDAEGGFLTLIPPILSAERAAEIVLSYAAAH
ncbi:SCO family protein [Oceanibium sediminis]|uniref:SCO family protein n=1 Tax=Oceanibium sediminis TaxID=2026339 RepID=UPI001E3D237D|nr:SCO family protein [Oceanibium sediminis]